MTTIPHYPDALADRLGIFARTFIRDTASEVAAEVAKAGYAMAHWNFSAMRLDTLGSNVTEDQFDQVKKDFDAAGLAIPSVSCTYNITHPDPEYRRTKTVDAVRLIGLAPRLDADVVTLCSGTRDASNQWRTHPDNATPEAWKDMRDTLDTLLAAADQAGVLLGIEPESANTIKDVPTARRLLDELGDEAPIGIILDCANLLSPATISQQKDILAQAVDLVGDRVIGTQAKDVVKSGYSGPGAGMMDYPHMLSVLAQLHPVPLIVQDADAADAPSVHDNILRWSQGA